LPSCNLSKDEEGGILEIDFIGPEQYYTIYKKHFRKIGQVTFISTTLEELLFKPSHAAVVMLPLSQKAPVIHTLLEMGKDVLTPFPLANNYIEFDALQGQCNLHNRRLALIDPYRKYPSLLKVREEFRSKAISEVENIELHVQPGFSEPDWWPDPDGYSGPAGLLIRLVAWLFQRNPISIKISETDGASGAGSPSQHSLDLDLTGIPLQYRINQSIEGWRLDIHTPQTKMEVSSDGSLKIDNPLPGIPGNLTHVNKDKMLVESLRNFISCIRSRREPEVNSLDAMAGIALDLAILESKRGGEQINMVLIHSGQESDKEWLKSLKH